MSYNIPNVLLKSQLHNYSKPDSTATKAPVENRKELNDASINSILEDELPFDIFRKPGMAKILSFAMPGYTAPHRDFIRQKLALLYCLYTRKLRDLMLQIGFLALTSDIWKTSHQVHFIALTAHAFTRNYEHLPIVIGCRRIIAQHLSASIGRYIKYEPVCIGIKRSQIISITTDNDTNIKEVAATLKFGSPISCMAHNLNLVVKKGLCLWIKPKAEKQVHVGIGNDWK